MKCATLWAYLDVSDDTVARRAIPWQDDPVPYNSRYPAKVFSSTFRHLDDGIIFRPHQVPPPNGFDLWWFGAALFNARMC